MNKDTNCRTSSIVHNDVNIFERNLLLSCSLLAPSKGFWIKYILYGSVVRFIMTNLYNIIL